MKQESKVKPFYIKYEEWMSSKDVVEVFDKAISVGVYLKEGVRTYHHPESGDVYLPEHFMYFGVNCDNETYFTDYAPYFGDNVINITLAQVDTHLGLTKVDKSDDTTPQSLVGCKIDLRNEDGSVNSELSAAFQEACFAQGVKWRTHEDNVVFCDKPFLYVDDTYLAHGTLHQVFLEDSNKEIKFEFERKLNWSVKYMTNETTRKTVEIGGVSYYEDKLLEAVQLLESAKVVDSGASTMGTGTPPDRPVNMQ